MARVRISKSLETKKRRGRKGRINNWKNGDGRQEKDAQEGRAAAWKERACFWSFKRARTICQKDARIETWKDNFYIFKSGQCLWTNNTSNGNDTIGWDHTIGFCPVSEGLYGSILCPSNYYSLFMFQGFFCRSTGRCWHPWGTFHWAQRFLLWLRLSIQLSDLFQLSIFNTIIIKF